MSEITRTEKFLRACIDGEPCKLKPLTRMEKLLAELNETLAGGPSEVVILPETELTNLFSTAYGLVDKPFKNKPTLGGTYTIVWDGVEHTTSSILDATNTMGGGQMTAYVLGNTDLPEWTEMLGSNPDASAPFCIMLVPDGSTEDGSTMYAMLYASATPTTPTLSILQTDGAASGGSAVETMHVNITSTDGVYKADKPFATVLEAVLANKPVEFHLNPGTIFEYRLHLTSLQRQTDGGDVVIMNLHKFAGGAVVPYAFMADENISVGAD